MRLGAITTSWDDGAPQDLALADLLKKYGIAGTYYIPRTNRERPVLSAPQIRDLASEFEIGGHTIHHLRLDQVSEQVADAEIHESKKWLADVIGREIRSFCYPAGKYTRASVEMVRKAGFTFARTVQLLKTDCGRQLRSPTTLQAFPHGRFTYMKNALKRGDIRAGSYVLSVRRSSLSLAALTTHFLDEVEASGGVFHLWGHSWEIEENGLWRQCEDLLKLLSERKKLNFCQNWALAKDQY